MKRAYFTPSTIAAESNRMLRKVQGVRARPAPALSLENTALLILDMQDYFLDQFSHAFVPSAPAIVSRLDALIRAFSSAGLPIIFTRHLNTPEDAAMMGVWWRDLILPEDPLSEITQVFDLSSGTLVQKNQYDAFHGSSLENLLRDAGVEQLVICGVMTHLCCETSARSAFVRGFNVLFPVDGTATYNEDFHEASLLNLAHGFAIPVLVGELLVIFEDQP